MEFDFVALFNSALKCLTIFICFTGSADFFGLNHYYSQYATSGLDGPDPSWLRDSKTVLSANSSWKEGAPGFYVSSTNTNKIISQAVH